MRRVVSLFLPCWPTDRLHKRDGMPPDPRPLLTASRQGSKRLVMAVDGAAAELGLQAGMAVAHAQAMVPDLRIEDADAAGDSAALADLAGWCLRQVSPLVAPAPPDGIWIDVTGCTHFFAPVPEDAEDAVLLHLVRRLAAAGIAARAAIADTPGAAHAMARYGRKPLTRVPSGSTRKALAGLPAAGLRLDAETVQGLRLLGFDTIGQLMAAPRAPLSKRFGGIVLRLLDQATGAAAEPIAPILPPDLPRTRQGFPEPISTPDDLARATTLLAERLCEKLQRKYLGANRLDLVFTRVDGQTPCIRIGTAAPSRDPAHLARLLIQKIETIDPGFGIDAMTLSASMTDMLGAHQTLSELCAAPAGPDLSRLIDTLANRLGASKVFRQLPVQSDVPERSVRAVPAMTKAEGGDWPDRLPRPTRLFSPPHHVDAVALLPDHAPKQFTWRKRPHRIRRSDGPERIFGEWWKADGETWAVRDYFQVEDEAGQRFWLFRRGDGESVATGDLQWFLHGMFG